MSDSFQPIPPEDEALPVGKILLAAAAAVAIFTVAVLIAWRMSLAGTVGGLPNLRSAPGMALQRPFALEKTAQALKLEQQRQLSTWGWVDREQQLIHIPIDRAIEQLVADQQQEAKR